MSRLTTLIALGMTLCGFGFGSEWTAPVEVTIDQKRCVAYRAKLDGQYLVVEAALEAGWHTFTMDNQRRALEKLAGKQSLGIDQQTEITASQGLEVAGPWYQSPPKDFSKAELRWFSWGFENRALFVAKVKRSGRGPANIAIRGQACTESSCKNIDVAILLRIPAETERQTSAVNLKSLVQVR